MLQPYLKIDFLIQTKLEDPDKRDQYSDNISISYGEIKMYAGSRLTEEIRNLGFINCNGARLEIYKHKKLYELIQMSFQGNGGDGRTYFNIPDLRGNTIIHLDEFTRDHSQIGHTKGADVIEIGSREDSKYSNMSACTFLNFQLQVKNTLDGIQQGTVRLFSSRIVPIYMNTAGYYAEMVFCNGQFIDEETISIYPSKRTWSGYQTQMPNFRSKFVVGTGKGVGLTNRKKGSFFGSETIEILKK
jgi:hypothetical protein